MKRFILLLLALFLSVSIAPAADAHGVAYMMSEKKAVALDFYFSTGEPMSFADAKVFSPANPRAPFQSGRTDAQGRLAFVPDGEGEWRVLVDDGEGHRVDTIVLVSDSDEGAASESVAAVSGGGLAGPLDTFRNALLGVSLIFNIAAAVTLLRARRRNHAHQ